MLIYKCIVSEKLQACYGNAKQKYDSLNQNHFVPNFITIIPYPQRLDNPMGPD